MSLDFQQVREQVKKLGEGAQRQESHLRNLREIAGKLLESNAGNLVELRQKVEEVVRSVDASLRCAVPVREALNAHLPTTSAPPQASILAADGSQIFLDHHAAAEYFLINIGVIQMSQGASSSPKLSIDTDLRFGEELMIAGEYPSEEKISLMRDVRERQKLVELAEVAPPPIITLTDGPLELWGAKREVGDQLYTEGMDTYLEALSRLHDLDAITAGYVDKPSEDYVVRLLEIAMQPVQEAENRPLRGVRDWDLFSDLLLPGERSAVFQMQSRAARMYRRRREALTLHFFYLNIGRAGHPLLARVDHLGWIASDDQKLDALHTTLLHQCRILGAHPYPYVLHRAHETALVSLDEKKQLEALITHELLKQGIAGEASQKQSNKDLGGKRRYTP
jgi:hypothetical protein